MKRIITTVLLICVVSSFISCTGSEAGTPNVYDLSAAAETLSAANDDLNVEAVQSIINKAVKIYDANEAVKLNSARTVYKTDVSHIDLEFAKSCTKENYSAPFELYRNYLSDVQKVVIELLLDYFPEENTVVNDIPPYINGQPPTHVFYIQKSDDPANEVKVVAWNDDIYYHDGEAEPIRLYPLPEQNEIEQQFWKINNQEEEISLYQ